MIPGSGGKALVDLMGSWLALSYDGLTSNKTGDWERGHILYTY
jgi:hypothetical protein